MRGRKKDKGGGGFLGLSWATGVFYWVLSMRSWRHLENVLEAILGYIGASGAHSDHLGCILEAVLIILAVLEAAWDRVGGHVARTGVICRGLRGIICLLRRR